MSIINGRMAAEGDTVVKYRGVDSCATVTIYTKEKKIVVDFGTTGCKGKNGRTRTGKWLIAYNKHWKNVGAEIMLTLKTSLSRGLIRLAGFRFLTQATK